MTWILAGLAICGFVVYANWWRGRTTPFSSELVPNCLLTRHPLLFISGRRTIFYFLNYWNWIPLYLANHGYEVYVLNLPWRDSQKRRARLRDFLEIGEKRQVSFHVFADFSSEPEMDWIVREAPNSVSSANLVVPRSAPEPLENRQLTARDLRPDRLPLNRIPMSDRNDLQGPLKYFWETLIALHNLTVLPARGVSPVLVGVPLIASPSQIGESYLKVAISLAESDLRCSH